MGKTGPDFEHFGRVVVVVLEFFSENDLSRLEKYC